MIAELFAQIKNAFNPPPIVRKVDEREYKVRQTPNGPELSDLIIPPSKPTLQLNSLTGFRDAYVAKIDGFTASAVQVIDYNTVALVSLIADENGQRHEWLRTTNQEKNPFPFEHYQTPEAFLLSLQMGFLPTEEVIQLQKFASSLSNESSIGTQDDGYSQTITVKQGSVTRAEVKLPPRIKLMPYRTFREIDPVESEFIVRLKGAQGQLPTVALIPVDAGRWKHDTALLVKYWMVRELPEGTVVIA
jgi:hypothetical protein